MCEHRHTVITAAGLRCRTCKCLLIEAANGIRRLVPPPAGSYRALLAERNARLAEESK